MRRAQVIVFVVGTAVLGHAAGHAQQGDLAQELKSLFEKGIALRNAGKPAEAIPYFEKAVALAPKVYGPDHLNTAGILGAAGTVYSGAERYKEAVELLRRSLAIREKALPDNDLRIASSLNNLGATLTNLAETAEAEKLLLRCLAIRAMKLPKDHADIVLTLTNLGACYHSMGRYADAETQNLRVLRIRENAGKDTVEVANALADLSETYRLMGRFEEAESFARRSLEIRRAKLGHDHYLASMNLNTLGILMNTQGRFKEADKVLREALAIREKTTGKNSIGVATSLNNLALLYGHMNRLDEAESFFRRALAIQETQFGPDHPKVATLLTNFAAQLSELGRTDEALKLLTRSLAIQETKLAKDHPDISYTIGNLASLHHDQGRLKEAEALFRRSLSICEARFGKDHFETATMASNLGGVYLQMNRLRDAEAFFQRALQIREARLGKSHAHVGASLAHLAGVFLRSGDLERADEYYRRSLLIAETVYGKDGEQVARIMVRRTSLNQLRGFGVEAAKSQNRALEIHQARLGSLFTYTSEANVYDYLQANNGKLPLLVNLAAANRHEPATTELALTWVLRLRGAVFDSLCRYRKVQQLLPYDADLEEKINRRRSQKAFLANAALAPPSGPDADRIKKQIAAAHVEVEQLDSEMRRTLAKKAPDAFAERETTTVASVRAKLRADSALIEFCHTPIFDFKRLRYLQHHYLAFVLRPNKDAPTLIDLGPAKEIDAQIESLRKAFTDFQEKLAECETADEIKALEKNQEKLFKEKSASLHAKLMAPLAKSIGDAKMLYIVAEAALNRLPFECLVGPDGQYLVERHRCAYLASGRDLLRTRETLAKGTVVFAGPDFKLEAAERLAQAEKVLNKKPTALATRGQHGTTLRSAGFKALPGAAAEAIDIQKNLGKSAHGPVKTYVGADALEEVLKSIPAPRVLHLATHGFFLDREIAPPESTEEMDGAGAGSARKRLTRLENPLLRSGIVLAGANTIGDMDGPSNAEDGWVMAEEIALLNLHGTELVVLSACQTGLGDIKTGEGVQGLRRAFLYAGARTLVTSLFEVPDAETRELMQRFYASMSDGRGTLDALHGAQLGMIESRRKERGAAHPFFWASFVLVGNGD